MKIKSIYRKPWFVYILECKDKTLYTGATIDIERRIKSHNTTNKCRYTRFRKPIRLLYWEKRINCSDARRRESEVKKFSREKKLEIIRSLDLEEKSYPLICGVRGRDKFS